MILGVDPGRQGALALVSKDNAMVYAMPDTRRGVCDLLKRLRPQIDHVFIEKQKAVKGWAAKTTTTSMTNYGILLGALMMMDVPVEEIESTAWQKTFALPTRTSFLKDSKPATEKAKRARDAKRARMKKHAHVEKAQALFPDIEIKKSEDGKADALLVASHGMRMLHGS